MSYIDEKKKLEFTQKLIAGAKAILVATSPFFVEFDVAEKIIHMLDW